MNTRVLLGPVLTRIFSFTLQIMNCSLQVTNCSLQVRTLFSLVTEFVRACLFSKELHAVHGASILNFPAHVFQSRPFFL